MSVFARRARFGTPHLAARSDLALVLLLAVVLVSVGWAALLPRAASLDARAARIEAELRCPVCQGLSIADSPAQLAREMRSVVREQLAAGASDDVVRAYFVARYGAWILLTPAPRGLGLGLWLAPGALLIGGSMVLVGLRRGPRPRQVGATGPRAASPLWVRIGVVGLLVSAVAVPLAIAVGPRLPGQEITGQPANAQAAASIRDLEAAVRARPGDVPMLAALGEAYLSAGRESDAATSFERALTVDPQNVPSLLGLGVILLGADRPSAAGPLFDRVLALAPDQPDALLYRALARYETDGAPTAAVRADLQRFLAVAPADPRRAVAAQILAPPSPAQPAASQRP